jgi:hypothetical protein
METCICDEFACQPSGAGFCEISVNSYNRYVAASIFSAYVDDQLGQNAEKQGLNTEQDGSQNSVDMNHRFGGTSQKPVQKFDAEYR